MVLYRYRQKYAFQMKYFKKKNEKNLVLKYPEILSKDHGLKTRKWVIRPPVFLISNYFTTNKLSLPYYIQRFIKQKSPFVVKKLVIKKKMLVL